MNPKNPKQYALRLLYYSTSESALSDFKTEHKVTPGWQINIALIEGQILEPKPLTQIIYLYDQTNASRNIKIGYRYRSQPLTENRVISS